MGTDKARQHTRIVARQGKLRQLRLEQGYRQQEFANRVGISRAQLSMIENGASGASEDTAIRIAERLRCDFNVIFDVVTPYGEEETEPESAELSHERPLFTR